MQKFLDYDRKLSHGFPEEFREGAHLCALFAASHYSGRLNEMNAFRLVRDHPEMELSVDTVLLVYDALTLGTEREGKGFREQNGYIDTGEFFFIPVPADQTAGEMEALCKRYEHLNHPNPEDFDDVFRFLLEFGCIHPMEDGNGRLSSFLTELLLQKAGLSMAPYLPLDTVFGKVHGFRYMREVIRSAGSFYGQKPYEYEGFIRFSRMVLEESYEILKNACRDYPAGTKSSIQHRSDVPRA